MPVRGYTLEKDAYLRRLRKIEGQVRGRQRLIDEDTYRIDVLPQIASVRSALDQVALGRRCSRPALGGAELRASLPVD